MPHRYCARILFLAFMLFGCGEKPSPAAPEATKKAPAEPRVVRIGYQKIGAPFLLKERSGELQARLAEKEARAEWVEFQAGPPLLEAMRAGAVDIGYVGETPPVFAQAGGVPFVYIATDAPAPASEAILVPKSSNVRSVAELKGKHIALNRGSNVHNLLLVALEKAGLKLEDVQVTYLAPPDARAAFDSGQLDAWVIWDPFQAAAEIDGARVLQDGTGLVDNRFYYVARREFAQAEPQLVSLTLDAFKTLSAWAKTHPEDAARSLATSSGVRYEALLKSEQRHTYELGPITPEILGKQQVIADRFRAQQLIPKEIQLRDAVLAANDPRSGS